MLQYKKKLKIFSCDFFCTISTVQAAGRFLYWYKLCLEGTKSTHQIYRTILIPLGNVFFNLQWTKWRNIKFFHSSSYFELVALTLLCSVFVCSVNLPTSGCIIAFSFLNCSIFSFNSRRVAMIFSTAETFCCSLPANMSAYLLVRKTWMKWMRCERDENWKFIHTFRNVSIDVSVATIRRWPFPIPLQH